MTAPDDNEILFKVGDLIRRLTNAPDGEILIGRANIVNKDYRKRLYVVDEIPPAQVISSGEKFDGIAEKMKFMTMYRADITIDVYGATAYTDAKTLTALVRSQAGHDAKTALGFTGFNVSSKTDLKELTGSQYINRIQLACVVQYCETVEIDTMRIEVARMKIITEEGTIYDSESE